MAIVAEKFNSKKATRITRIASASLILLGLALHSRETQAATVDWLAADLNTTEVNVSEAATRATSSQFFNDDVAPATTVTQNIRVLMRQESSTVTTDLVDAMIADQEIGAEDWLSKIPAARAKNVKNKHANFECVLDKVESRVSCDDAGIVSIGTGTGDEAPKAAAYGKILVEQISREGAQSQDMIGQRIEGKKREDLQSGASSQIASAPSNHDPIILKPRKNGLVTVDGGHIDFAGENQPRKVMLDDRLAGVELSIFVRDPSTVVWDDKTGQLIGKKPGHTEVFVVTPGRISIIEASVNTPTENQTLRNDRVASTKGSRNVTRATAIDIPSALASLDGLDSAATKGAMSASGSALAAQAPDLAVENETSRIGQQGLTGNSQFIRAKAKASFENVRIKIVDDRSVSGLANYPVGGVTVKVAGTEFMDLTNGQGELEIRDVPSGARLLLDISDNRGYIMPQMTEIVADRDGVSRGIIQTIIVRRFSSLDLTARSGGVVQDMQKSSLCGRVVHRQQAAAGVAVNLDTAAAGPFYFNKYGFVDLRLGATGPDGHFCFFNVEPGPVAIGFRSSQAEEQLAAVVGVVQGRHSEESFDLAEARHVSTTLTTIATANEQLGADTARATRHDIVDQADIYAVGSGQLMVPVDEGIMTTATAVLPMKGRVWTVSASPDFETSVQAVAVRAPTARQVSTLIPNGFISDMSVFAQTTHNSDNGSVVVEHGNFQGLGGESVKMRLVDVFGRDIGDGWYFADQPVSKAIFFNVPAGVYALVVETGSGHWIAADTVMVYSESVSFAKTGGQIEKVSTTTQHASLD